MKRQLMPAEWDRHEACLLAWPTHEKLWGESFKAIQEEYAGIVRAISEFEPVILVVPPGSSERVRDLCDVDVATVEAPMDDSWLRASGPIFVYSAGKRIGVDFRFNGFGGRFFPHDQDDLVSRRLLHSLNIERQATMTVLEGGAITVDGEGTLIATEQCVLNSNRNQHLGRCDLEAEFARLLGVEKVIWLPYGHLSGETDGHIDHVCQFAARGRVITESCGSADRPDYLRLKANRAVLENCTDSRGRSLEILEMPPQQRVHLFGRDGFVNYVNFYIANSGVVIPLAGTDSDEEALATARLAFPDHRVVGVEARTLAIEDGGIHCITQQLPAHP
ncbi:agmatine/peptidylarginine deiminase [Streptomyces sp. NPDC048282]|uniref:agmatine deiminase family protein n=1 Tax=Streptomyces sp. NPDC048282 TaxID=3365528 RepID=UPI0037107838